MTPIENALTRSTVRILAGPSPSNLTSTGTGFFYKCAHPTTNDTKLLIVTNKHVIAGASIIQFVASSAESLDAIDAHGQPIGRRDQTITWPLAGKLINHPENEVDLCAIDVTDALFGIILSGRHIRSFIVDKSWLPDVQSRSQLRDIEPVLVIGYPIGMWDHHNNMPIARSGTTATHPLAPYHGKPNFLIDVAAFSGSSGSPVFTYESPMFRQPDGSFSPGTKAQFIGVIWGVIERNTDGILLPTEIPAALPTPRVSTPLNIAVALHGDAILAFDSILFPSPSN